MTTTPASATSPLSVASNPSATRAASATTDKSAVGRTQLAQSFDMFLTLLTTQMKNQDPLSPMDSTQFTQQLVQMAGVEQQLASNDYLKQLVANSGANVSSAVGLIGKQVRAMSDQAKLSGGQAQWGYVLSGAASDLTFEVVDANGSTVQALSGADADKTAGEHTFTWDGKNAYGQKAPDGIYTLRVTAKTGAGDAVDSAVFAQGLVTSIQQANGQPVITVGGVPIPLSQVTAVTQPPAPAPTPSNTNDTSTSGTTNNASNGSSSNPTDETSAAAA